ncbi:Cholinesterase [Halotydeus destructor]|nr:Cholinesterase [Halotydeus destructor]
MTSKKVIHTVGILGVFLLIVSLCVFFQSHNDTSLQSNNQLAVDSGEKWSLYNGSHVIDYKFPQGPYGRFEGSNVTLNTSVGLLTGLQGNVLGVDVVAFLGVPYAVPPLGDRRFRRPLSMGWQGHLVAQDFRLHCVQEIMEEKIIGRTLLGHRMSEDCLYLNIWAPKNSTKPLSTVIWIYGGGFNGGTASMDETDGRILAAKGQVIVVTFNYRTGLFGFLDLGVDEVTGNQGLYDMEAALDWVISNVHRFGGSANDITLMGNSAGAISVGLFMANGRTSGKFKRAILQSGSPILPKSFFSRSRVVTRKLAKFSGCNSKNPSAFLNCLQSLSTRALLHHEDQIGGSFPFNPVIDGDLVKRLPVALLFDPNESAIYSGIQDVLMGSNADEGSILLHLQFPQIFARDEIRLNVTNVDQFRDLVETNFSSAMQLRNEHAVLLAEIFFTGDKKEDETSNLVRTLQRVLGDLAFTCPVTMMAKELSRLSKNVYLYQLNQRPSASRWGEWMGATHGDEYVFLFGHPIRYPDRYTEEDVSLSNSMIDMWSSFIKTGTPKLSGHSKWPKFSSQNESFVKLSTNISIGINLREQTCNLFSKAIDTET